jgi:hypothetical protein
MANRRGTAACAGATPGVVVPGAYMTLLTYQCRGMYELDPRFYDTEDPESVAAFESKKAAVAARAQELIERRAASGDPVYIERHLIGSNILAVPRGVPMFAKTLENRAWFHRGSFKVTADDVVTPSDLLPPLTCWTVGPDDPLPDEWRCGPRQPSIGPDRVLHSVYRASLAGTYLYVTWPDNDQKKGDVRGDHIPASERHHLAE